MSNLPMISAKVKFYDRFDTVEGARNAAAQEAAATGGIALPAVLFKQGERLMLSTAFLVPFIQGRLQMNPAAKRGGVDEVRAATNRPVMPEHVESVKKYLKSNMGAKYILPPITLNARHPISVYGPDYESTVRAVTIVIPPGVRLEITDGGHRKCAIDALIGELDDDTRDALFQDAVAVMITIEDDISQIHQDFADASKTKPLPKSQLAAYDRRNPANGVVLDMIERCELFRGRIDSTSQTLSKNSPKLFLTNQVRQMVKELLIGAYAMADEQFEQKARDVLGATGSSAYIQELDRFITFLRRVTQAIPVFRNIVGVPPTGVASMKIADLRSEGWVCLQATGLVVIGRIGYELIKNDIVDWESYVDRLGEIDWRRTSAIWQGNIIQNGKVMTQQGPVKGAVAAVRSAIGLDVG